MEELFRAPRTEEDNVLRSRGDKYVGSACKKCKTRVRYASSKHCVTCNTDGLAKWQQKNRNVERNIKVAVARAVRRYESW